MRNVETKMSKIAITVIALLVVTVFSYGQSEVQIPAKMDNTLYEDASGELSNGAGQSFFVGRTNQTENSIRRGLIAFDISGNIPANAVIRDVMLTLSMSKTSSGAQDIMLHRVMAEWGEGSSDASGNEGSGTAATTSDATWTYRMYNTELWDTPGGDYALTSSATLSVDNAGSYTWGSTQQMVDDVQSWLDNPSENFGWILVGNENSSRTSKRFDSHEHPTGNNHPVLSITYTTARETAVIDRFSEDAGNLFVRDDTNGLPGPNEPIDFDMAPFITKGLGPNGEFISYYNFDVQPTVPAPIYVLFREGEDAPVAGQMNIIDVVPGDEGYNDFWHVQKVTVPADYEANTITSFAEISNAGYAIESTPTLVNCPVVPEGSTAKLRLGEESSGLVQGWYKGMIVYYFNFSEKALMVTDSEMVPISPIYVSFNINPDMPGGGPPSGFMTEEATGRTHNVVGTLPMDETYSPLWVVNVYDNADFGNVSDLSSAQSANILAEGVANVNCPVVLVDMQTDVESETEVPLSYRLEQNFPNPFNPSTQINFSVASAERVTLKIYNIRGELVAELLNKQLEPGDYSIRWNALNKSSGLYFYTLEAGSFKVTKKMTLLK